MLTSAHTRGKLVSVFGIRLGTPYRSVAKTFVSTADMPVSFGRCELDTHADTFVARGNCLPMHFTERVCDVMPYSDEYEAKKSVPIAQVATGYTTSDGKRYILIINEALWIPELEISLMNPNQLRHYGVQVQDNPYDASPMTIRKDEDDDDFIACLRSDGTDIFINTWTPTGKDLEQCKHIVLTSPNEWDPRKVAFPSTSEVDIDDIESRNVSAGASLRRDSSRRDNHMADTEFGDNNRRPLRIFDIQVFNARIMKSIVVPTVIHDGPLAADMLMPPKAFISADRHSNTTPEDLSEVWNISIEQATMTLQATTQNHIRSAVMPLSRRYRTDRMYEPKRLRCNMASDTMDPRMDGLHGNRYCQVYGNKLMFAEAYPIAKKNDCEDALHQFLTDYRAPDNMITDGSREQTAAGSEFQKVLRKNHIPSTITQPHRPNQNPAETGIRELRKRWYRAIFRTNCPKALWNYGLPHFAKLMQLTASNAASLQGRTPLEVVTGETPDISQYLDFGWYDWVWFKENAGLDVPRLGRFLGIANSASNLMSFYILPISGRPIVAGTVQRVTHLELQTDSVQERVHEYNRKIADKSKEGRIAMDGVPPPDEWSDLLEDDEDFAAEFNCLFDNPEVAEADDTFDPDSFDLYLNMELAVDHGGNHPEFARVTKRLRDHRGLPIGTANDNPILDTWMYEVEYADRSKQALAANVIAENMFASVDEEGHRHLLLDSIIDTRKSPQAVSKEDAFVTSSNGTRRR